MKKYLILSLLISLPAYGYTPKPKTTPAITQKIDSIEIIDGIPKGRKFTKLTPILGKCDWSATLDCAMKQAKKQAAKAGGDAIIQVEVTTSKHEGAGYGGGVFMYGASDMPIVKGWAIKWAEL